MPTYRVLAPSYINNLLYSASVPGADVFVAYDGDPGTNLEPTDDEGRARQAAYFAARGQTLAEAGRRRRVLIEGADDLRLLGVEAMTPPPPASVVVHHVPIPSGWIKLDTAGIAALAARLGAPPGTTGRQEAMAFVRAELARRTAG